jgi:hypothetical protein
MQLPIFPDFIPLASVDRETYEALIDEFEPYSDFGYTSLYVWGRDGDHYIAQLNGNLVLSMRDYMTGEKTLSFIGNSTVDETAHALLEFVQNNEDYVKELRYIPGITAVLISSDKIHVKEDEDNHDYILSTDHFVDLPGPRAAGTRRKLSQFMRAYGDTAEMREVDLRDKKVQQDILHLSHEWAFMGTEGSITAHQEIAAINRMLQDIDNLNKNEIIHCLGLYISGKMEGFCIYETRSDYAIVHFIKGNVGLHGTSDYVMVNTMRNIRHKHGIAKVNHEQDLGIEGLRAAKRRYCPQGFLKKYSISYVS